MNDLFQSTEYTSFLSDVGRSLHGMIEPFCVSLPRGDRKIGWINGDLQQDGNALKRFLSRRAIINGGAHLESDITESELRSLLNLCISKLRHKAIYIETRNFKDYSHFRTAFEQCGFVYEPHYNFIVNTEALETAESNLGKSRKRDIRTSLRDGASVIDNPDECQIKAFYSVLKNLYETRVKTPLFPVEFFLTLSKTTFSKFLLVQYNDQIIGGTVCVFDDEKVYEWFACGQDGVYKNIFPSTLATWSGIRFAAESGHKYFDMMGAGAPGDGGYGVRDFKAKFGGKLVEYGRFKYICNPPLYKLGKLGVSLLKKI